eukprot:CAMPEP_0113555196 /NCGR_PEP_ID=MMETSP0015_2-20120614/16578_1 /TAXON_ID=2838 /ORGANISM="Odontella" /LENGTH=331 /DNA_ID=CAMNT_0000456437 /DNA_START=642 /DNA_END=1637 /DNA_ORIENTATION=+ /assembly_acc=CAM_ASM_000160
MTTEHVKEKKTSADVQSSFYEDEEHLKKLCDFLRGKEGAPVREAIEMDKRVHYIKGEKLVDFLVEPKKGSKWPPNLPRFKTRQEANTVCKDLCRYLFIHRSDKRGKGDLVVSRYRDFDESGYFTWMYEGDKTLSHMMTTLLIGGFLFCTFFPIWPNFLKVFVWYMSVSLLIFIFFLVTFRWVIFLWIWILGYDCWFLPNLFDETLSFADSFKPVISCEKAKSGQLPYRIGVAVAFFSSCYWAVTQEPGEFESFKRAQLVFIEDIFKGTLISDMSQEDKENIDTPKMQSLVDILKDLDSRDDEEDLLSDEAQVESMLEKLVDEEECFHEDQE